MYFESNKAKQTLVSITSCDIHLTSTTFKMNKNLILQSDNYDTMYVETSSLGVENCGFYLNQGTPLSLKGATTLFHGDNMFNFNKAVKGGGINADQGATITVFQYGIVTFKANTAYYGGTIYIGPNNDDCVLKITSEVSGSYIFTGNDVITEGSSIYTFTQWCDCIDVQSLNMSFDEKTPIVSPPTTVLPLLIIQ